MTIMWLQSDPIVMVTRPLEQIKKLAAHAEITFTDQQVLEKVLRIMRATRDFEHALMLLENKSDGDKN